MSQAVPMGLPPSMMVAYLLEGTGTRTAWRINIFPFVLMVSIARRPVNRILGLLDSGGDDRMEIGILVNSVAKGVQVQFYVGFRGFNACPLPVVVIVDRN